MAPRGVNWRRPHTSIYNDNYRYGTNLYSGTLSDIQKRNDPLTRALRADLTSPTFSSPAPSYSAAPALESKPVNPQSPTIDLSSSTFHGSVFESMLNSALHSSYAVDVPEEKTVDRRPASKSTDVTVTTRTYEAAMPASRSPEPASTKPPPRAAEVARPTSLYDDAELFTSIKKKTNEVVEQEEATSVKKKRVVKDLPSPTLGATQNGPTNPSFWKDQCRDLQSQVDTLTQAMADMSGKLKGELSSIKGKLHSEISDLHSSVEQSTQQSGDLQKVVKKQANQLMELQASYDDLQRHLQNSLDEVSAWQRRHQTLRKEMDRLRGEVEETLQRSSSAARA